MLVYQIYITRRKEGVLDPKKATKDILTERLREESTWPPETEMHLLVKITTREVSSDKNLPKAHKVPKQAKNHHLNTFRP